MMFGRFVIASQFILAVCLLVLLGLCQVARLLRPALKTKTLAAEKNTSFFALGLNFQARRIRKPPVACYLPLVVLRADHLHCVQRIPADFFC